MEDGMEARILDLDGSLFPQRVVAARSGAVVYPARDWGPRIRLACSFRRFARWQEALAQRFGTAADDEPHLTWYGSGDFHHVTLALLRRLRQPFNLLVLDNHPDWMRFVPFMHCGTWLAHAAALPLVRTIYHLGGDVDFDNFYRSLAPWSRLRRGKIVVVPAIRRYQRFPWKALPHEPLRRRADEPAAQERIAEFLQPFAADLAAHPLYISLDKDVMTARESVVNWDSGHLTLDEILGVLDTVCGFASKLVGMDLVGDWSPVVLDSWFRRMFHLTMHPPLAVEPGDAARTNEQTNLALLERTAQFGEASCAAGYAKSPALLRPHP
jgi:hypothetical protein